MASKPKSRPKRGARSAEAGKANTQKQKQKHLQDVTELALNTIARNATTSQKFSTTKWGQVDELHAITVMRAKADKVRAGDMTEVETVLTVQAATLDSIFNEFAQRAAWNAGHSMPATETYLRLALKAQAQCCRTLETLAEIKNPRPVAFVRQANIAHGHQQVNNVAATGEAVARAGSSNIPSNELLEVSDGEWLDTGTQGIAGAANQDLAAVGAIDRPPQRRRQGA